MKIPHTLKFPRKLKKEVKKGIVRNTYQSKIRITRNPLSCLMYYGTTYSGSNTKSFRRLCKYIRKMEKSFINISYYELKKETDKQMAFMEGAMWDIPIYSGLSKDVIPIT